MNPNLFKQMLLRHTPNSKTSGKSVFWVFLVFCKTSGKLFLLGFFGFLQHLWKIVFLFLVFEESIADVHPHGFAEIISFENFIGKIAFYLGFARF